MSRRINVPLKDPMRELKHVSGNVYVDARISVLAKW